VSCYRAALPLIAARKETRRSPNLRIACVVPRGTDQSPSCAVLYRLPIGMGFGVIPKNNEQEKIMLGNCAPTELYPEVDMMLEGSNTIAATWS
jgi:hypothetical protein